MKLSQNKGPGMPVSVRKFWDEVERTKPTAGCEDCDWPNGKTCEGCKALNAQSLISAQRFA